MRSLSTQAPWRPDGAGAALHVTRDVCNTEDQNRFQFPRPGGSPRILPKGRRKQRPLSHWRAWGPCGVWGGGRTEKPVAEAVSARGRSSASPSRAGGGSRGLRHVTVSLACLKQGRRFRLRHPQSRPGPQKVGGWSRLDHRPVSCPPLTGLGGVTATELTPRELRRGGQLGVAIPSLGRPPRRERGRAPGVHCGPWVWPQVPESVRGWGRGWICDGDRV